MNNGIISNRLWNNLGGINIGSVLDIDRGSNAESNK